MPKTKLFIEKARAVHGDRYDYDRVVYVRNRDKIVITCAKHGDFEQTPSDHLMGKGCAKCSGRHIYSTQEWIKEAIGVHGDVYDYSRVAYVSSKEKVIITCEKHGDFEQIPNSHLSGYGCIKCGFESTTAEKTQKAKDSFIERARAKHGDLYDYGRAVYVRSYNKVIITCKIHGEFEQTPKDHLNGRGCAKCGLESAAEKITQKAKDGFIEKARGIHGDRYDYSETSYVIHNDKVIITCAKHGDFEQTPNSHLNGHGCTKCGLEESAVKRSEEAKDGFIEKARAVHRDRYDYSKTVYVLSSDKVTINCKEHGAFEQIPSNHLRGQGCPSCPARSAHPTNLYLMHNGLGKVKVGYSIDTDKRIKELNSNAPFKAELLETWTLPDTPTVRKIEGRVHRKLAKYHAGLSGFDGATEWFNASPERAKGAILKALSGAEVLGHSEADSLQLALI